MWTSRRPLHISRLKIRNVKLFKFWEVHKVEHLAVENKDFSCDPRFSNVLTKLQVLTLTDYKKIVLLESDLIVMHNVDEYLICLLRQA